MIKSVKTAVFPVAGLGTRFLPITKTGPKEMLPIVDKPLVQYVVEEALAAGIEQLIFVTNNSKYAIEDYFDRHHEYERRLEQQGKLAELEMVRNIVPSYVSVVYIRQSSPAGLGDAVLAPNRWWARSRLQCYWRMTLSIVRRTVVCRKWLKFSRARSPASLL